MERIKFEDLNLSSQVIRAVGDMGFETATEVQSSSIPLIMEGKDVLGRSSTGTGKTAAFGIPAVESIKDAGVKLPQVLIMCPTRELAMQVSDEIGKFAKYTRNVRVATVYGGQSMDIQIRQLRTANIVVGTPGRIMDHIRRKTLKLHDLKMVVLDEADEMLNMGFYEDIQTVLKEVPEERQTILFSATMPPAIQKITEEFQTDPQLVAVDQGKKTIDTIDQFFYQVKQSQKMEAISIILQQYATKRSIVFCNTKKMVDDLVDYLNEHGFKAVGLHGDMRQNVRTQVMNNFKSGRLHILVATDVAARGIDVEDIDAVINFDIPQELEYYIHRIGRTGRAGKTGVSATLVCNKAQLKKLYEIRYYIKAEINEKKMPTIDDILIMKSDKFVKRLKAILTEDNYSNWEKVVDNLVEEGYDTKQIASAAVALIASKDKKIIPHIEAVSFTASGGGESRGRGVFGQSRPMRPGGNRPRFDDGGNRSLISVNIGRNDRIAPNFLVGAIVEGTGLSSDKIGKIEIYDDFSTISMPAQEAQVVVNNMSNYTVKGQMVNFSIADVKKGFSSRQSHSGGSGKRRPFSYDNSSRGRSRNNSYRDKPKRDYTKKFND